ncbi:hypothetical protein KA405_02760 [Patescibacteria group bacterium]|nr:hypothetical protein [Patescibacteria group bacterium]
MNYQIYTIFRQADNIYNKILIENIIRNNQDFPQTKINWQQRQEILKPVKDFFSIDNEE